MLCTPIAEEQLGDWFGVASLLRLAAGSHVVGSHGDVLWRVRALVLTAVALIADEAAVSLEETEEGIVVPYKTIYEEAWSVLVETDDFLTRFRWGKAALQEFANLLQPLTEECHTWVQECIEVFARVEKELLEYFLAKAYKD